MNRRSLRSLKHELIEAEAAGCWRARAWVLMPDHVHLLFELGHRLPLARTIARFKAKTKQALERGALAWQGNFFEHRLRSEDSVESVLLYMYLNPYRAALVAREESYGWFGLGAEESMWFKPLLDDERPFPEWLR